MSDTASTTEAPTKAQLERKKHGAEAACQLIGHLGVPKKDVRQAVYVEPSQREDGTSRLGYIWTTVAINRGVMADGTPYDPSWWFVNIYGVKNDDDVRPSSDQMSALAELLQTGQRVKLQGVPEVRQGEAFETDEGIRRDTTCTVKLFMTPEDVEHVLDDDNIDAGGRRPLTLLPRIGNDNSGPDMGF